MATLETDLSITRQWLDLSLAQRAVWLDVSLSNSPAAYILLRWARLRGRIDTALANQALTLMVVRHDALRLRVDTEQPRQWLHSSSDAAFSVVDLSEENNPEQALESHLARAAALGMPLGDNWLFSLELIKLGATDYCVLSRCHHLLADEVAVAMILGYWLETYRALISDTPSELPPPSSYLSVIASDVAYTESPRYRQDLDYWTSRFKSLSPALVDSHPNELAPQDQQPLIQNWLWESSLYARFLAACTKAAVTPQRVIFALVALVFSRRYDRSDLTIGMALHRRDASNLRVVGMFAGMLPIRCRLNDSFSLLETIKEISAQIDRDLRHQRLPADVLSRELGISRGGLAQLFQIAFSFLPADRGALDIALDGVEIQTGGVPSREASPITVHVYELPGKGGISLDICAHAGFLEEHEVVSLMRLLELYVDRFVDSPGALVESLSGTTPSERLRVLSEWNASDRHYRIARAERLFEERAYHTPDAVAVVSATEALTYAQLNARSNQLSHLLLEHGLSLQSVVGVALDRSVATVVSLLAILKAGCTYLPLDPSYPPDRLAHMLSDSHAGLVITSSVVSDLVPSTLPRVLIDRPNLLSGRPDTPLSNQASAHHPAYIIYTSGSTGKPKGVVVPHTAAVNLAFGRLEHDPISAGDKILAAISVGFDVSIGQLLLPLLSGATVVIAGDLRTMTAQEFWDFLQTWQVTHINSVPSFFESVLDAAPDACSLVRLMLGGEPLSSSLVRRLRKSLPGTQVINMYGPTEACIDATFYEASGDELPAVLPIGKSLPNYRAYILNDYLEPVGIGIPGDLHLAGAGLAHAYIGQPALTAERFIANPFSDTGERLYKTGDRARWRQDGSIDFLGRADTQVKIRGHRIELGEIEASLLLHPSVAQAVVLPNTKAAGTLVAYVVLHSPAGPAELRSHLATHVPEYMIPAAFCVLPALPLTPNGKLDHRALPVVTSQSRHTYLAPETETQKAVAGVFAELLGITQAGISDNFFELGGHSLLATRLVSKLRTSFAVSIPLRTVFESPTVQAISAWIDEASKQSAPAFTPLSRPEFIPLSYNQERLWFLSQLQKDSTYNVPVAVRLRGSLDVKRAVAAVTEIVSRHEVLRTRIVMKDGKAVQQVQSLDRFQVSAVDLVSENDVDSQLNEWSQSCFDLAVDLPIRAQIISFSTDHHILAIVVHHTAFDGWSAGLLFQEFAQLYTANVLPHLPIQYADFAVWQKQQDFSQDIAYWKEKLAGAPPVLDFPASYTSNSQALQPAAVQPVELDARLHQALLSLASANGASLFMVLHAAFALLLARWSGQDDVVIGTAVANRVHPEFENLIGCFVNTVPLRARFQRLETFAQLLSRIREDDLAAYEHQGVPFERLVEELQPDRSLSQSPIFQAMLVLQNQDLEKVKLPGLQIKPYTLQPGPAKFNLTLNLGPQTRDGALIGSLEYASDLYDASAMRRLASQLKRLLQLVAENPDVRPMQLDLLEPADRLQILSKWNGVTASYPAGRAEDLFQHRACQTPDAVAVSSETESLTYADLDTRSSQLGDLLVKRGLKPQSVVGVALERSVSTVVAFLAILKAGCIYLPLDPDYPADRLAHMLSDSNARLVITSKSALETLPANPEKILIDQPETWQIGSNSPIVTQCHASDTAYIIYTSGSTGKPKGVAVSHDALVNLAFGRLHHDPIGTGDKILAAISVGFDVSIGQLLLPLLSGATVVIASDIRKLTPNQFWEFLNRHRVTHINSVPSFFESILEAAPESTSLVRLMLGGEPLSSALVKRLQKVLPCTQVFNMYGPTEVCIDATCYHATGQETSVFLPIGTPLPNYRAYILDDCLEPVGIGINGDLYLAGSGLAHCYINQPGLTAERFLANPFGIAGERIYKTGDRARWLPNGNIDFLGRSDTQVKIRGHRIELGEIESALLRLPGMQEAAVIVREDTPGDQRLIAYYKSAEEIPADSLRASLSQILPGYMVPAAYVPLLVLPLTSNGKLDRKALPIPGLEAYAVRLFEPPQGAAEEQIAEIFAAILNVSQVGRQDNFFELGGHSLLAMTVVDSMNQAGLSIDARHLFTAPTVAALAQALTLPTQSVSVPPNGIQPGATAITPAMLPLISLSQSEIDSIAANTPGGAANIQDIYPLAPLQEGILFHHLMAQTGDAYLTPFLFGFQTRQGVDIFLDALRVLLGRHDILRTAILWNGLPEPVQVVWRKAVLLVEEVEIAFDADAAVWLREEYNPRKFRLDVRQAPMMRAFVSQDRTNNRWLLLMLSHHLILDHTSMEVVLQETGLISAGNAAGLPEAIPFRQFVAQSRLGIPNQEHETYFRAALGDVHETTAPYGLLHVQGDGEGIRESTITLLPSLSKRVRERSRALCVGPASLFHLAWSLVLAHVSGRRDVVFGTLLLGRLQNAGVSQRALGLFINTLPLRLPVDTASVESALRRTHQRLAELIRHENASLALAQRCSGVAAPAPLFSSLFNFRQSPAQSSEGSQMVLPGVELVFAQERTDYPIAIAVDDHSSHFSITVQADAPADPAELCRYLETAVNGVVAALEKNPSTPLHRIAVLPAEEYQQVVGQWNETAASYPLGALPELFEQQVSRSHAAIAVIEGTESLTYSDLNMRAERVADLLVSRGVTAQSVVGVALPRSVATVVSVMAILKIGAIYLPLDPAYPPDRLTHMLADSGAGLVIVNAETERLIPASIEHFYLDSGVQAPTRRRVSINPGCIAYIIYTSGSTGKPKGVAVPHSAAVNLAFSRQSHDPITIGDRVLAAISVGFDVSIGQLLLPLLSGATVVIASDLRTLTPLQFWGFLEKNKVSHINSVPSFFDSILDAAPPSSSLTRLMLGGEPLTPALVRRLQERLPKTQIVNMYGPTEACIDAACYPVTGSDLIPVLPIGKPLPNYRAYILDEFLDPVGVGVAGELYLGGAGLAHSYVGQAALTAERFIADPFSAPGQRLYKTGDLARWRNDGNIDFLGRADTQVKIRGHRIELGEIESALLLHPSVIQAVVVAEAGHASSTRLIAYLVFKPQAGNVNQTLLREHLSSHLPEYMIPSVFVTLDALPLTQNGKVDLKALPKPGFDRVSEAAYVAPESETEIAMEKLWQQVLGIDRIGIHDDFFALGGHSLAVMRLISLCNSHFKTSLALRSLFDNPTISKLALAIDTNTHSSAHPSLVSLRPTGSRTPLFCIHPAGGAVLRYVPLTNALNPDQPVYGLQARALLEGEPLGASVREMAADYISAIQSVQPKGPYQLLGWSSGGMLGYEMAQQLNKMGETVSFLGLMDTSLPDNSRTNPSEKELMHAFATTFGYEDLLTKPGKVKSSADLQQRILAANRLPQGLDFAQFKRFYAVFCNTLTIYGHYVPQPWPGSFVLFRALQRSAKMPDWSRLVSPKAIYIDLDCTHADLPSEHIAPVLAKHIEQLLKEKNYGR